MNNYLIDNFWEEDKLEKKAIRDGFGEGILGAGKENENVVVLNADLPGSLRVLKFKEEFPNRYFQVGIAEQNMAGIGTGLANYGKIPFITTFAAFSPGLNFSQIRLAAISKSNLKIVGSHYGLNVGKDGASAQMNCDVAMMRSLPGMVIINACDAVQAFQATHSISQTNEISYLRVTREKFPVFMKEDSPFHIGVAQQLLEGNDLTVIATGSMVYETLQAIKPLIDDNIGIDFLNIHTVKPLDETAILRSADKTKKVVIVEEHNVIGGLGESVTSLLSQQLPTHVKLIGVNDTFAESGTHRDLWKKYGLDREDITRGIKEFIE